MGFEPTRAEHNGLAVHRLNHSATSSYKQNTFARINKNDVFEVYRAFHFTDKTLTNQIVVEAPLSPWHFAESVSHTC